MPPPPPQDWQKQPGENEAMSNKENPSASKILSNYNALMVYCQILVTQTIAW